MAREYNIKVTVRNNLLLRAIAEAGYESQVSFARAANLSQSAVNSLVAMRAAPVNSQGEFSPTAKIIMEVLGASPEQLWTEKQLYASLPKNTYQIDVSEQQLKEVLSGPMCTPALEDCSAIRDEEFKDAVAEFLSNLRPREQIVLKYRFGLDGEHQHIYDEIATKMSVTRERVRQIEMVALRKVRERLLLMKRRADDEGTADRGLDVLHSLRTQ